MPLRWRRGPWSSFIVSANTPIPTLVKDTTNLFDGVKDLAVSLSFLTACSDIA